MRRGAWLLVALCAGAACAAPVAPAPAAPTVPDDDVAPPVVRQRVYVRDLRRGGEITFSGEDRAVRDAVGARLAQDGWEVVPAAEVDDVATRVAMDPRCAAPARIWRAFDRAFPDTADAEINAGCRLDTGVCELTVVVSTRPDKVWRAPLPAGATLDQIAAAAAHLQQQSSRKIVGIGLYGNAEGARPTGMIILDGNAPGARELGAQKVQLDACLGSLSAIDRVDIVRVELDAAGKVSRCELASEFDHVADEHPCLCTAASHARFGAGAAGRRLQWHVFLGEPPVPTASGEPLTVDLQPKDPDSRAVDIGEARLDFGALTRCFDGAAVTTGAYVPFVLTLDAVGKVTDLGLAWPSSLDPAPRACVEKVLRHAGFPCPGATESKVYADLRLTLGAK